jgi:hypothetical protein
MTWLPIAGICDWSIATLPTIPSHGPRPARDDAVRDDSGGRDRDVIEPKPHTKAKSISLPAANRKTPPHPGVRPGRTRESQQARHEPA